MRKVVHYITHWEDWHWFAKYIVIGPAWLWLCLKARSLWFFTPSNPTIVFGGFTGETKRAIYDQLPPYSCPRSIYISPSDSLAKIQELLCSHQLSFPLAAKPDAGMMGFMFRKIESLEQLRQYHAVMTVDYIIQEFVTYPLEVSVFYYRFPGEQHGHITGFLRKEYLEVTGDGKRSLKELILDYPRAQFRLKEFFSKHESKLDSILPKDETFRLSEALNLSRGGKLVSLEHEKDDRLLGVFDYLSHYTGCFFYGRYDIKCASVEDLKQGRNFSILEFNGAGAEPHHVYGNGNSFFKACKILVDHWNILYQISTLNFKKGITRWNHRDGWQFTQRSREHFKKLKKLDAAFEFSKETKIVPAAGLIHSGDTDYPMETFDQKEVA